MTNQSSNQIVADKEPDHVLLDCVSSPDGRTLYCKRIKPEDADKILQKNEDSLFYPEDATLDQTDKPDDIQIEHDLEINLVSDQVPGKPASQNQCEPKECEVIEDVKESSSSIDEKLA